MTPPPPPGDDSHTSEIGNKTWLNLKASSCMYIKKNILKKYNVFLSNLELFSVNAYYMNSQNEHVCFFLEYNTGLIIIM